MAAPPPPPTPDDGDLGQLIRQRTPYKKMEVVANWKDQIEWDAQYVQWSFQGVNRRVAKALRIPVTVTIHNDKTGQDETYRDWLLIGYEGGSGE